MPGPGGSLSGPLARTDSVALFGRHQQMAVIEEAADGSADGARQMILIEGEPGIGKTRLAIEAAEWAAERGFAVLVGGCDPEVGPPFLPFAEALERRLAAVPDGPLGRYPGDLARVTPSVAEAVDDLPAPFSGDPGSEQHRLYDAVASWLSATGEGRPVLLVLEDLHWASAPTVACLRHVWGHLEAPILVLGTLRATEIGPDHPLRSAMDGWDRAGDVHHLPLAGLDDTGVADLMEALGWARPDAERVAALQDETAGNPFFLRQVAAAGAASPGEALTPVPAGVFGLVRSRVARLGPIAGRVLEVASVVGQEVDLGIVADVLAASGTEAVGEEEVVAAAAVAIEAGLLADVGGGRVRFVHALARASLLEAMVSARRLRLHRAVAMALASRPSTSSAAVARHWLDAVPVAGPEEVAESVLRAANDALQSVAPSEAVDLVQRALNHPDLAALDGEVQRELQTVLGEAAVASGDPAADQLVAAAAQAAADAGDGAHLARAMLAGSHWYAFNIVDPTYGHIGMLELAVDLAPNDAMRARLSARLGAELTWLAPNRSRRIGRDAVDAAVASGDLDLITLAWLSGIGAFWCDPEWEAGVLDAVDRTPWMAEETQGTRWMVALGRGDLERGRPILDEWREMRRQHPHAPDRLPQLVAEAAMALLDGRLADADAANQHQLDVANELGRLDGYAFWTALESAIARERGGTEAVIDSLGGLVDLLAGTAQGWYSDAHLAIHLAEAGDRDGAAAVLARAREAGWPHTTADHNMSASQMHLLGEAAVTIGDLDSVAALYRRLLPYAGTQTYDAIAGHGATDRALGRMASALGDVDRARQHLQAAEEMHRRMGAPLLVARTLADQAVLDRGPGGAPAAAASRLADAAAIASAHEAAGTFAYVEAAASG